MYCLSALPNQTGVERFQAYVDGRQRLIQGLQGYRHRQRLEIFPSVTDKSQGAARDHSAFLNSYAPQDEGLYDDAAAR